MLQRTLSALAIVALLGGCAFGISSTTSSGISSPAGPSLEQFGLTDRCPRGGPCADEAFAVAQQILERLGPARPDPVVIEPGDAGPADRLAIQVDQSPPLRWQSSSGDSGEAMSVTIDLTGLIDGTSPYALVEPDRAYEIDPGLAVQLRDALFIVVADAGG